MAHKSRSIKHIDSETFIRSYMKSDFNWQVAEELNLDIQAVNQKANYLRRNGVNLPKRFKRDDVEELNAIIAEIERSGNL